MIWYKWWWTSLLWGRIKNRTMKHLTWFYWYSSISVGNSNTRKFKTLVVLILTGRAWICCHLMLEQPAWDSSSSRLSVHGFDTLCATTSSPVSSESTTQLPAPAAMWSLWPSDFWTLWWNSPELIGISEGQAKQRAPYCFFGASKPIPRTGFRTEINTFAIVWKQ